jgi:hypothetical protein
LGRRARLATHATSPGPGSEKLTTRSASFNG